MVSVDSASGIEATDEKHKEEHERPSDQARRSPTPHVTHERSRDGDDHHDERADPRREERGLCGAQPGLLEYDRRVVEHAVDPAELQHREDETSKCRAAPDGRGESVPGAAQRLLDAIEKRHVGRMLGSGHLLPEQFFLLLCWDSQLSHGLSRLLCGPFHEQPARTLRDQGACRGVGQGDGRLYREWEPPRQRSVDSLSAVTDEVPQHDAKADHELRDVGHGASTLSRRYFGHQHVQVYEEYALAHTLDESTDDEHWQFYGGSFYSGPDAEDQRAQRDHPRSAVAVGQDATDQRHKRSGDEDGRDDDPVHSCREGPESFDK